MIASPTPDAPLALTALDLGSGPCPAAGYVGVDLLSQLGDPDGEGTVLFADLLDGSPWPFDDASIERLRAWHVIEHIPHSRITIGRTAFKRIVRSPGRPSTTHFGSIPLTQDAFFWFFDEAYRIAKSGCRFELAWPHPQSDAADQDPTHCRRVNVASLHYLSRDGRRAMHVTQYPVACDWVVEPGSVQELGSEESLAPFTLQDGSIDIAAAKRAHGAFHEIRATLIKP